MRRANSTLPTVLFAALLGAALHAQTTQVVVNRGGATVVLEPYAQNIIRVTLSKSRDQATAAPGYGFVASPVPDGWTRDDSDRGTSYRSSRMVVSLGASHQGGKALATQIDISKFFSGSAPGVQIGFSTPEGKPLLKLEGWSMSEPNYKDGNAGILNDMRPSDQPFFQVGATFHSPDDEHYYGLGQNQEGYLDHRGHKVECWNNYTATGGPTTCVPFLVSNYGYGLIWDNPVEDNH